MRSLVEIGSVFFEKKILKFRQCVFAILYLSPLGKGRGPYLSKLESPAPKNALCQVCLILEKKMKM